ncbi:nucleolar pre-ribosomal-associated protein 1 isoform X3 [Electrophorus electricus]|uniref:nucleolar pre-ribosomal-associated protein 1 isoform X3 n=1 Tax=Electrophorus electricus TaxID=8005 RepID=UPI0015D070F8|nr:nucleolar pre-ribosomal-associated protein 1 isoform X3 [Electrophorus electricus]
MANKRQKAGSSELLMSAKKPRLNEDEFNGTVFKAMLKNPSKAFKGLETFIKTAKKLPCDNLYDVVEGYIKISAECAEIVSLLDGDNTSEAELMLIFQSLEQILLRTASDLSHFRVVGSAVVKKTVSANMKLLKSSLYSVNYQFVRQCLCLLAAMVSQGADAAREIFSSLVFSKTLSSLARRRDSTGRPDIRMAYIQFALSFLMYGDSSTVGHVVDTRDFLTDIFCTGLKEDRISIVNLILSTLQTKLVQNTAISKTQKVRLFNASTLAHIASLYRWNGIVDVTTDHSEVMDEQEGGRVFVRELVHNFLLDLCCSRKHGISFHDPSLGTSGRAGNIVLLQFVVNLKQATEDELVADLLVSILKCNPDILTRYFRETQFSFIPRMKGAWLDSIALLKKIYQAQPEISMVFHLKEMVPASHLLSMVLITSLPPVCNKAFFIQGLSVPSVVGQHATLSVLAFILRRAQKNMEHCLKKSWESFDAHSPTAMEEFVQLYREELSKILPDVMSIVTKWQSLSKKEREQDDVKADLMETEATETTADKLGEREPKLIVFKALLLQVICLYQRVVPHLISQCKFDFSKLLKGIVSEKGMKEVPPVLQYQILQMSLELPPSKFSWFKLQDVVDPCQARGEQSVLYVLLKMFVSSSSCHLKTSTRKLILKVLRDSGIFEHTWRELELWLDHLLCLKQSQQETVIQFLDQVLMRVVSDPFVYMDKIAAMVQHTVCGQDRDTDSIPISHIDDDQVICNVVMESSGKDNEEIGLFPTDDIILQAFPFSVVVPAVLEARNTQLVKFRDEKGVVCEYICAVLCDILHCQRDPLALCLTLHHYDMKLLSAENSSHYLCLTAFIQYYYKWLPHPLQETQFSLTQCTAAPPALGFDSFLKACYNEGSHSFLTDSFRQALENSLCTLHLSQFTRAVNQTLLYLRSFVDTFSSLPKGQAVEVVSCLLEVLHALLLKVQSMAETQPTQPEPQEQEELHLEMNSIVDQEFNIEQALVEVFQSVFKHPVLEQWFLAVELGLVPHLSLEPGRVEQLCGCLTEGVLLLLQSCAKTLGELRVPELISHYMSATQHTLLKEIQHINNRCLTKETPPVKAFLALHEYMEPSSVKTLLSALLLLPQSSLLAESDKLSVYGQAILKVLTNASAHTSSRNRSPRLTQAHLHSLAILYMSCHSVPLEDFLLQVLRREPDSAKLTPTDVLLCCLKQNSRFDLAAVLVQNCSTHCLSFELWCLEQTSFIEIAAQNSSFLFLLTNYLEQAATEDPCRPKNVQKAVLQMFTQSLLPELSSAVLHPEAGMSLNQHVEVLSRLIGLGDMTPELNQLINDLPAVLHKPEIYERWQLADSITEKLANTQELLHWKKSLLTATLRCLSTTYKEQKKPQVTTEKAMLQRLKTLLISPEDIEQSDWNSFVKSGLKYRYQDGMFLDALNSLLELMYTNVKAAQGLIPLVTINMMATSHSLFLPTMLASQDEADGSSESKGGLVSLLLTLVKKCPEICSSHHFIVLLGAYEATLSNTDQKLLLLMKEYENRDVGIADVQCMLWGATAVEYHKARKSLGPSLWQQPTSEQLLAQLATDRMLKTVALFPLHRHLFSQEAEELIFTEEREGFPDQLCPYDPCFLLPLFSFILRPESVVDCQKFVSSHALGVTVVALSSYDHNMRAAAYHILGSFYQHLEASCFREKKQLLYLLETVRNGVHKSNIRVSFMHATYITKMVQQILRPEEHMYLVINRFLLRTQYVDLRRVPEFFKLFYSFDLEHKLEREWVLKVLEEGMRDRLSYELCEQQSIYHTLLGFCSSPLVDQHVQIQIIDVLRKTALVTNASCGLTHAHGVLTWTVQIIEKNSCVDGRLLNAVIGLLSALWFTNMGQKESKMQWSSSAEKQQHSLGKWLPLPIINDFLTALLSVIRHLRNGVKAHEMLCFLKILASVLRHRGTIEHDPRDARCLAMHPQELSCSAVLTLLQCWGTLSQDTTLLCVLQNLANKHNIKALLGNVKEKVKGNVSSEFPQSCMEKLSAMADEDKEKHEQCLVECKPLLTSVLTHWEPWPLLPNSPGLKPKPSALTPPNSPDLHSGDMPDCTNLINATAHILLKWVLKALSEQSYDNSTYETLKWFQQVIVPHKVIAKSLLNDEDMRSDLLALYHQTCEYRMQKHCNSKLETLQLFTTIMVHLLEEEGTSNVLHTTVLKACLHPTNDEGAKKEARLKLLSLYIHELLSRAKVPQMFLTHARLVTRHRKKTQKKSRAPIMQICEDVLSTVDMTM